ncbi:MAG TPA: patatin-like phospholipase family protein [Burkholderiales bacterium]|nr:patatin-like phospholipase family protein [Burkholderiales bacterium]
MSVPPESSEVWAALHWRERRCIEQRRIDLEAVVRERSPPCYVRAVDAALVRRDSELRAYLRERLAAGRVPAQWPNAQVAPLPALSAVALSGGGVRSASFNLGVLQRLHELGLLTKADYLSTVSGGGYIGCSLAAYADGVARRAAPGPLEFPFERANGPENDNVVIRHLRRFSSYLVARGFIDALVAALTAIGGIVANALVLAPLFLLFALLAVYQIELDPRGHARVVAAALAVVAAIIALGYAAARAGPGWEERERRGRRAAVAAAGCLVLALLLLQPVLIVELDGLGWGSALTGGGLASVLAAAARLRLPRLRGPVRLALLLALVLVLLWLVYLALAAFLYHLSAEQGIVTLTGNVATVFVGLWLVGRFLLPANCGSLHAFYRDRLSKAYFVVPPGTRDASRLQHRQDCQLSTLRTGAAPYLLVNACLNVSDAPAADDDLAGEYVRPGRKGTFFLFSTLGVGSDGLGYVRAEAFENENGLASSLATAMAISGAAFGANMGYNTRAAAVALLTLLNVRTGAWMKFPWQKHPNALTGMPFMQKLLGDYAYLTLAREAWSRFDNRNRHGDVLLSDGGHVDNLGIYPLLKRRCTLIIASDAEADPAYTFEGLSASVRLAKIDLGYTVDLDYEHLAGVRDGKRHFAVGTIDYGGGLNGTLIYLKSSMTDEARRNVFLLHYQKANPAFPHEPTSDQFFTESQFEAYRALGYFVCSKVFEGPG